jgi:hypothetical protein
VPPRLRAAKRVLWIEALSLAAWPALAAIAAILAIGLLGLPALLPAALHIALLAAAASGLGLLVARGVARFRRPADADAERRLEQDSGLKHRPFASLRDLPAETAQPAQLHLWQLHQARARAAIAGVRLGPPRPLLAIRHHHRRPPGARQACRLPVPRPAGCFHHGHPHHPGLA